MIDPVSAAAIGSAAAPIVADTLDKAGKFAEGVVNQAFDWIRCEIIDGPTLCRKKKTRELYKATMARLIEEAQIAADQDDWISAFAIAQAAAQIADQAGFLGDLDAVTIAEWDVVAESMADLYSDKAKADLDAGKKPRHRARGGGGDMLPWILGGLALLALAGGGALFGGRRKRSG